MGEGPARRPARQRAPSEQQSGAPGAPAHSQVPASSESSREVHDPGGWLVIGMMALMMVAVAVITVLTLQAG